MGVLQQDSPVVFDLVHLGEVTDDTVCRLNVSTGIVEGSAAWQLDERDGTDSGSHHACAKTLCKLGQRFSTRSSSGTSSASAELSDVFNRSRAGFAA